MAETLAQLLDPRTAEDEEDSLLSVLKAVGYPVTDWEPGGAGQTIAKAVAASLADHGSLVSKLAASGFVTLAKDEDPVWLDLIAEQIYGITRARATYTKQLLHVTCELGLGPQTLNPGFMVAAVPSGRRYVYEGAPIEVPDNGSVDIEVKAESPGAAYVDAAGTIIVMVTPLPGLGVVNRNRLFGGITGATATRNPANEGSGAVTPSGTPVGLRSFTVVVTASGSAGSSGALRIEVTDEGGVKTSIPVAPVPTTYAGLGDSITLTFDDGLGSGFIINDRHTFQTPGSPITANGVDDESQESLASRCLGRWPALSLNIVADKYVAWVRQCSIDNAFGIEKVTPRPSATVAGQTEIIIATATGSPSGGVISTIQEYLNDRDGITDTASVVGATNRDVGVYGSVYVKQADLARAQAASDTAWIKYITGLPIGGDVSIGSPGVVRITELYQAVMDAGAIDAQFLELNGDVVNLALASDEVAVIPAGSLPSEALIWVTVT